MTEGVTNVCCNSSPSKHRNKKEVLEKMLTVKSKEETNRMEVEARKTSHV